MVFDSIVRDAHSLGVTLMELGIFMEKHGCEYRHMSRLKTGKTVADLGIRMLKSSDFLPHLVCDGHGIEVRDLEVTPSNILKYTVDRTSLIIDTVGKYYGMYRYIGDDEDAFPVLNNNMSFIQCSSETICISLQHWMSSEPIVKAMNEARSKGMYKKGFKEWFMKVPVPDILFNDTAVEQFKENEVKILALQRKIDAVSPVPLRIRSDLL